MKNFDYVRPATVRDAVTAAAEPGAAYLAAGTNLLDLMKGGVTKPDRLIDITHLPDLDRSKSCPTALCASALWFAMPILPMTAISRDAFPPWPKRYCPVPPRSFATPQRLAAIFYRERAARIFTIPPAPATNAVPAPAATSAAATTGCMRYWDGARVASRLIHLISVLRSPHSTRLSRSRANRAGAKFHSRRSIGCPATHRTVRLCSSRAR